MEIYNKLFEILNSEDILITDNPYLILPLHTAYSSYQRSQKKYVWPTLPILTVEHWINHLWEKQVVQSGAVHNRLLTRKQEQVLWQTIMSPSSSGSFLHQSQVAKLAQRAWQLLHERELDYQSYLFKQNVETKGWQVGAYTFEKFLRDHHCVDYCQALKNLIQLFKQNRIVPPKRIFLLGFLESNPLYKKLFQTLEAVHCKILPCSPRYASIKKKRFIFTHKESEYVGIARWAYQALKNGKKNIGCVLPNLSQNRSQLINSFKEVYMGLDYPLLRKGASFDDFKNCIEAPLTTFPLIKTALMILSLELRNSFSTISPLIQSPYIAGYRKEQSQRAELEVCLRRAGEYEVDLVRLATISHPICKRFAYLIKNLSLLLQGNTPSSARPSQWADYFSKKLSLLRWPGDYLNAEESELLEAWSELLNELSSLDFIVGEITQKMALQRIQILALDSSFRIKSVKNTFLHIVDLRHIAGIYFDTLWVGGLDDRTWPEAAKPNPFIPYSLQQKYQFPHATHEREYFFSSLVTEQCFKSSEYVTVSHSQLLDDQKRYPSSFIVSIKPAELNELQLPPYRSSLEKIWLSQSWEYYTDEYGPSIGINESFQANSQLFQSQANCPFQAFARFRLVASFHAFPVFGLKPSERGTLIHHILEKIWNELDNQASLLKQSTESLDQLINRQIQLCLEKLSKKKAFLLDTCFRSVEQQRLMRLIKRIMELEKKRPLFIKSLQEQKIKFYLGKLEVHLRADRIDTLPTNQQWIIDYKTGFPLKINWLEGGPHSQLLLYSLAYPKTVRGIVIMHIAHHKVALQGITEEDTKFPGIIPLKKLKTPYPIKNWLELLSYWRNQLETLGHQFESGCAEVNPKRGSTTCRQCDLQLLCRFQDTPFSENPM